MTRGNVLMFLGTAAALWFVIRHFTGGDLIPGMGSLGLGSSRPGSVYVGGYGRSSSRPVKPHWRKPPQPRR